MARHFFSVTYSSSYFIDQSSSVPAAVGAILARFWRWTLLDENSNGSLFSESTAVRRFCGIA
jgi:hypothetical protein